MLPSFPGIDYKSKPHIYILKRIAQDYKSEGEYQKSNASLHAEGPANSPALAPPKSSKERCSSPALPVSL